MDTTKIEIDQMVERIFQHINEGMEEDDALDYNVDYYVDYYLHYLEKMGYGGTVTRWQLRAEVEQLVAQAMKAMNK